MSEVVVLTSRRWRVLPGVKSGNPDECGSYRSERLVKPPSLDRCCPGYTFVKLFGVDIFLALQARSNMSGEQSLITCGELTNDASILDFGETH